MLKIDNKRTFQRTLTQFIVAMNVWNNYGVDVSSYQGVENRRLIALATFPGTAQSLFLLFQLTLYFRFEVGVVHVFVRFLEHACRLQLLAASTRHCACTIRSVAAPAQ